MELAAFKAKHIQDTYFFDPAEYGKIYAFIDFANVRQWAKSFWPIENKQRFTREVDISKLGELIDCVKPEKKFFYYGHYKEYPNLPPESEANTRYRQSIYRIDKARNSGFTVRTKDIKEINDFDEQGRFLRTINKCNFDIEIAMDMLQKIDKYDTVFLWSGDSDFHLLLQYLKSKKKKNHYSLCQRFCKQRTPYILG